MKLFPNTLLQRTALYLGILLVFSQAVWFVTAQYLLLTRVRPTYQQQIIDTVVMAQQLIENQAPNIDLTSTQALHLPTFGALEILADSQPRPQLVPHNIDDIPGDISEGLQERFGPSALSLRQKEVETNWLRFPARGQLFWLKLPPLSTQAISNAKLFLISLEIALAVGGAYLIVFRLTKKLHYVTAAAKAIGRGEPPAILETSGPEEIRSLSEGFNQMSRDLIKLEADRRLMLAGISHDLRTPLTRLRIAVELANSNIDPSTSNSMVNDIEDMDAILRQFLDYARDGSEEPAAINDLNVLVQETAQRVSARGELVETKLGRFPPFIFRKHSIRRVLDNLVDNAVRYGKSRVRVETRRHSDTVIVTVSDDGPGIQSGNLADYIKPFAREDVARSERGAGLGLTIVDRVVRLHGGRLRLENAKEGGLVATIELPLRTAVTESGKPVETRSPPVD